MENVCDVEICGLKRRKVSLDDCTLHHATTSGEETRPSNSMIDNAATECNNVGWHGNAKDLGDEITNIATKMVDIMTGGHEKDETNDVVVPPVEVSHEFSQKVCKAWAKELYETKKEDREAIMDEIHGVKSRAVPETPELIETALKAMQEELELRCTSLDSFKKEIVECNALSKDDQKKLLRGHIRATTVLEGQFVQQPEFRLRFLRAEFFDVSKATTRYCKCLNHMHEFFGDIAILRPLYLSDLTEKETDWLSRGETELFLSRDKMGRRIFATPSGIFDESLSQRERHRIDIFMTYGVMAEDTLTQFHGAISLTWFSINPCKAVECLEDEERSKHKPFWDEITTIYKEKNKPYYYNDTEEHNTWHWVEKRMLSRLRLDTISGKQKLFRDMMEAAPFRMAAMHICVPDERIYHFFKAVHLCMIPFECRARTKIHIGNHLECSQYLCQYGISIDDIPASCRPLRKYNKPGFRSSSMARFLKARRAIDNFRKKQADGAPRNGTKHTEGEPFPPNYRKGTDCPEPNCVVFGDRLTYNYPTNVAFREYLQDVETKANSFLARRKQGPNPAFSKASWPSTKRRSFARLNGAMMDEIIDGLSSQASNKGLRFAVYDREVGWYRYLDTSDRDDRRELRKRISQTTRDNRKRVLKERASRNRNLCTKSQGRCKRKRAKGLSGFSLRKPLQQQQQQQQQELQLKLQQLQQQQQELQLQLDQLVRLQPSAIVPKVLRERHLLDSPILSTDRGTECGTTESCPDPCLTQLLVPPLEPEPARFLWEFSAEGENNNLSMAGWEFD